MSADPAKPCLARSVVLRHDRIREADLLLMPERAVRLTDEAGRILRLCDGERTIAQIITELAEQFPQAPVEADVTAFLGRIRAEGWLR